MIQLGIPLLFGGAPERGADPILNLPADTIQVRRRFRPGDFARAYVRTPDGVTQYALKIAPGGLELYGPIAANRRDRRRPPSSILHPPSSP